MNQTWEGQYQYCRWEQRVQWK